MGVEIERKFLINEDFVEDFIKHKNYNAKFMIKQGYILNSPEKVVRVRVSDDKCFITIKGENDGPSRPEFEYEIPRFEAEYMLNNMCSNVIEKTRYILHVFGNIWEIDTFHGDNQGLIVAECEIPSEDYEITIPKWVRKEVTNDISYYNNSLSLLPYCTWDIKP